MDAKTTVIDADGQVGQLMTQVTAGEHDGTVTIALDARRQVVVPTERLSFDGDGSARFDGVFDEFDIIEGDRHPRNGNGNGDVRVPVARERMSVSRQRRATGRVRVEKRVEEEEVFLDERLNFEEADIERVPVGRLVDEAPRVRREGDTVVIPVVEERMVKQLFLVEEVRVSRRQRSEDISEPVTLRRERVDIQRDRLDSNDEPGPSRPSP